MEKIYIHAQDRDCSAGILGKRSEDRFMEKILSHGWYCEEASLDDNKYKHTDFYISINGKKWVSVDVKAKKKMFRGGVEQDSLIWIELVNGYNYNGWIFGDQKYIAFELDDGFHLVSRKDVVELLYDRFGDDIMKSILNRTYKRSKINNTPEIRFFCDDLGFVNMDEIDELAYNVYRRKDYNEFEMMTFITKDDIISITKKVI